MSEDKPPTFFAVAECPCGSVDRTDFTPSAASCALAKQAGVPVRESVKAGIARVGSQCKRCGRIVPWRLLEEAPS